MSSADVAAPPPPEEPLQYPIDFASGAGNEDGLGGTSHDAALCSVSIFSALYWLKPLFELADWIPVERAHRLTNNIKGESEETSPSSGNSKRAAATPDVQSALQLLPQFEKFFEVSQRLVSQQEDLLYTVTSFTIPTPKGPKVITRSKVEGEHRARIHSVKEPTLTNTTAVFSLLPGHNQFLVYYEAREKLGHFNYLELDKLRFAWVAMRDLLEECKVFNLHDGTPTGLARRDLKKNNSASPFSLSPVLAAPKGPTAESSAMSASPSASKSSPSVGRGGGNARLHQGTSGNVITGPSKAVIQEKKEMAAKRFLKDELEDECRRRWPHTPVEKSCVYAVEEKMECDLPEDVVAQMGLPSRNNCNRKNTARKGPRFYFGTVELPLLNKKGGVAKFKAPRWWANRNDAINAAAETAVMALRSMK